MRNAILFFMSIFLAYGLFGSKEPLEITDHYNGQLFYNPKKTRAKTFFDLVRWRWNSVKPVENLPLAAPEKARPEAKNLGDTIKVTFVGHSTFLLQAHGVNVLTDPIWSSRCSPVSFLGPKRLFEPGIDFDLLPQIDVVVVSHNHYDHMDIETLVRLGKRDRPLFIVPLKNREILRDAGIANIVEHDWWASTSLNNNVTITSVPAQHWSGRWIWDRNKTLWSGFVISFGAKNVFFAGDTGFAPHFEAIKQRFKSFEIALLPIGAFLPQWFMQEHHLSPVEALRVAKILDARQNIPMHFGTFSLGDDGYFEAEKELLRLLAKEPTIKFTIMPVGSLAPLITTQTPHRLQP